MTRFVSVTLAISLALAAPLARAQSGDAGIASQLFDAGRDLMKRGDYVGACPKLAESARLEPRVGTLARLAECEEKIGHVASARGHWKDTVDLARAQKDDRAGHAEQEYKRVDAMVPRLLLHASTPTPSGFAIHLDDIAIGNESIGVPLPIDPGRHAIAITATEKEPWTTSLEAKPDGSTTTIEIPALKDAPLAQKIETPPPPPNVVAPPPPAAEMHRPLATVGVVTAIGGGVVLGAGVAFAVLAAVFRDQASAEGCDPAGFCFAGRAASDHDTAIAFANASTGAVIAGSVVLAAGVALAIFAPKSAVVHRTGLHVAPNGLWGTW